MFLWESHHLLGITLLAGAFGVLGMILGINAIVLASQAKQKHRRRAQPAEEPAVWMNQMQQDYSELQTQLIQLQNDLSTAQDALKQKLGTPQIVRFNAFGDTGSDLSFSIALVDEQKSGVVISSIYGREESRTYAKPVSAGASDYPLTEEEQSAISGQQLTPDKGRRRRPVLTP